MENWSQTNIDDFTVYECFIILMFFQWYGKYVQISSKVKKKSYLYWKIRHEKDFTLKDPKTQYLISQMLSVIKKTANNDSMQLHLKSLSGFES